MRLIPTQAASTGSKDFSNVPMTLDRIECDDRLLKCEFL